MSIHSVCRVLLLGFVLAAVYAPAGAVSSEEAIETTTAAGMPRVLGGSMLARACRSCAPIVVRLDAQSRFYINRTETTLADFVSLLDSGARHSMIVFYDRNDRNITRVRVTVRANRTGVAS